MKIIASVLAFIACSFAGFTHHTPSRPVRPTEAQQVRQLRREVRRLDAWAFDLGCRVTRSGQTYCSTRP